MRMLARKLPIYLITFVIAITIDFFIPRLMPGNPVEAVLARMQGQITQNTIKSLELQYGLNTKTGLWGQYMHYWTSLFQGQLGVSTGNLIDFLQTDPKAWQEANRLRTVFGQKPLR